jgi:hypothetical protein
MKMNTYIRMLICLTAIAVLAAPSGAQSTPFVIGGWIFYENDTNCNGPAVQAANATGVSWDAENNSTSNYYQLAMTGGDVSHDDLLQFAAGGCSQSNTTPHTVSQTEIDAGGFELNITLAPSSGEIDLIVESVTLNCGGYLFGNESNDISAVVKNIGTGSAGASNVSFLLSDGYSTTVSVPVLGAGNDTIVSIADPTIRAAGAAVTITVTADCDGEVAETDETNNASSLGPVYVVNNGYKGKTYTGGSNMTTWKTYDLNGSLVYSIGDSYYLSSSSDPHWTTYNASWDASDLPVTGAVVEARLYTTYTWDKDGVMPDDVGISFNGVDQTLEVHYWDDRTFPDSKPYGMLAYNVTDDFNTGGNAANLTNSHIGGGNVSMRGMLLVVVYENASEPRRLIYINEEFDLLYGGPSKCTTPDEATAWAPIIDSIDTSTVVDATLITVAPGADGPEGELIFNGQVWNDVWSFADSTQLGIDERDVKAHLQSTKNLVGFQSNGDWMEASNAFLVVTLCGSEPRCLGTCCNDSGCNESYAIDMSCADCIALGKYWHPNKDTACFGDTEPSDLCLDWCPECCDCANNDTDDDIDYPDDEQCTCGLDPSETESLPPIPELATFALIGVGLMLVVGLMGCRAYEIRKEEAIETCNLLWTVIDDMVG